MNYYANNFRMKQKIIYAWLRQHFHRRPKAGTGSDNQFHRRPMARAGGDNGFHFHLQSQAKGRRWKLFLSSTLSSTMLELAVKMFHHRSQQNRDENRSGENGLYIVVYLHLLLTNSSERAPSGYSGWYGGMPSIWVGQFGRFGNVLNLTCVWNGWVFSSCCERFWWSYTKNNWNLPILMKSFTKNMKDPH